MNVFEKQMKEMSIEDLAGLNVQLIVINNSQLMWLTSSGQLFPYTNHSDALQFELNLLNQPVNEPDVAQTAKKE